MERLKVVQVHISDPSSKPLLSFWMALSTLPALSSIEFNGPGCRAFEGLLNALVPTFTLPGLLPSEPFPSLQQLTLSHLRVYRKAVDHSSLFWQLMAFLTSRRQRGRAVPHVELIHCSFATPVQKLFSTKGVRIVRPLVVLPYNCDARCDRSHSTSKSLLPASFAV